LSDAYILNTPDDRQQMLAAIGAGSVEELFASVPDALRLKRPLDIPSAMSEAELTRHMQQLAARNRSGRDRVCFLGGGAYDHFIPSVVEAIAGRSEFYTAYTPYQAEASQGSLQAFFEYQTLICQLTGMDVANASLYEGGSAVAEAVLMAMNATGRKGKVLIAESVHPEYRQVLATYLANLHLELETVRTPDGFLDPDDVKRAVDDNTVCVVAQHPNFFGGLEEVDALATAAHAKKALFVVSFDPVSLGLLKRPGQYGADIAVAEGQGLGTPLGYGGPYLGMLACRKEFIRSIPGRLVGQTVDRNGQRCWTLTLQTREQHIRREKATSNICTNQGLLALRATVYLAALGPQGLKETADLCLRKAHFAAAELAKVPGAELRFRRPFFKEFAVRLRAEVPGVLTKARTAGYDAGLALGRWYPQLGDSLLVAVTEQRTRGEIDGLAAALGRALGAGR
jgi:glycine dehydrogenase subunit 1